MTSPGEFRRAGAPQQPSITISPGSVNLRNVVELYAETLTIAASGGGGGAQINPQGFERVLLVATCVGLGTVRIEIIQNGSQGVGSGTAFSPMWVLQGDAIDSDVGARVVEDFPVTSPRLFLAIDNNSADDAIVDVHVFGIGQTANGLALALDSVNPNLDAIFSVSQTLAPLASTVVGTPFVRHTSVVFNAFSEVAGAMALAAVQSDGTQRTIWNRNFTAGQDFGPAPLVLPAGPIYLTVENIDAAASGEVLFYMNAIRSL